MNMDVASSGFWTTWNLAPEISILLVLLEFFYLRAIARTPYARAASAQRRFFLGGLLSIAFAVSTPIGAHANSLFWCHMIQHVTLMMIAGPLLVLGTPPAFRPSNIVFTLATNPIISWLTYAGLMIGVHLPPIHGFIMSHPWAHTYGEIPLYIAVSYFFYFNLLDRNTSGRRLSPALCVISLFLMMIPETLTGFFIYIAPHSIYEGMFTLDDQRRGGSIMWSGGMIIDTIWMAFAVYHWIKSEERASLIADEENMRLTT